MEEGRLFEMKKVLGCWVIVFTMMLGLLPTNAASEPLTSIKPALEYVQTQTIATGENHSLAIKADGSLWAWGGNSVGQLGDGTNETQTTPIKIMDEVISISANYGHSLAIKTDGSLWAWGGNWDGQLGDGTTESRSTPVRIMDSVKSVSAGLSWSMAIKSDDSLWTWGGNQYGQLGNGTTDDTYLPIKIMDDVKAVTADGSYKPLYFPVQTFAIRKDDSLFSWGWLGHEMNDSTYLPESTTSPKRIMGSVESVSAAPRHAMIIKNDGSLWKWESDTEVKIMDSTLSVSTGYLHTASIKNDGSLWVWGYNPDGQIGDGTDIDREHPIKIMDSVACVTVGVDRTLAVKDDGSLWIWGNNREGAIGDGFENEYDDSELYGDDEQGILVVDHNRYTPVKIMDGVMLPGRTTDSSPEVEVSINGIQLKTDTEAFIHEDSTYVPLRAVAETLDCVVSYEADLKTAVIKTKSDEIRMPVGSSTATVNSKSVQIPAPSILVRDRIMVPLRFVSEALDSYVTWRQDYGDPTGYARVFSPRPTRSGSGILISSLSYFSERVEHVREDWTARVIGEVIVPQFDGISNADFQNELNEQFQQRVESAREWLDKHYEDVVGDTDVIDSATEACEFIIQREENGVITVQIDGYFWYGGGREIQYLDTFMIDLNSSKVLTLEDQFVRDVDYETILINEMEKLRNVDPDYEYVDEVTEIKTDFTNFYYEDDKFVLYYPPYELASGAQGFVRFPIPIENIAHIMR